MLKKTISHIGIYLILCNLFFNLFSLNTVNAKKTNQNNILKEKYIKQGFVSSDFAEGSLIIKFKDSSTKKPTLSSLGAKISGAKLKKLKLLNNLNIGFLSFDPGSENIDVLINNLKKLPEIEYVEKDYINNLLYNGVVTNDILSTEQWYLKSIQADDAWTIYNDLSNKTITSVNDSGIFTDHIDLAGNLKDLSSNCLSETGAVISGGCPKNGWNFVNETNTPTDIVGHGTHVAGTIGAVGNNETGVIGVTQNVEIMATKVGDNTLTTTDVIQGIYFAIYNGAKVINASYGGTSYSSGTYDVLTLAKNNGVLFIAAAGNDSTDNDLIHFYPSDYDLDNIISVASVGPDDTLASYSNYGLTSVDLAAPGGEITNYTTGEGGILSTYINSTSITTIYSADVTNSGAVTISGTGSDWYIEPGDGYRTQEPLIYTGIIDKTIAFNDNFSLAGVDNAELTGRFECDLGSNEGLTNRDDDFGDYLEIIIEDLDTGNELILQKIEYSGLEFAYDILDSNFYKDNLKLKFRFVSDGDTDTGGGCNVDFPRIKTNQVTASNTYEYSQGTSMATPVVTGVASMIWSYKPDLTYSEVKDIIFSSVDTLGGLSSKVLTSGKVNAKNAIKELISRYGITKNGSFEGDLFNNTFTTPLINLDGKNITLSGSYIYTTSTGTVITLSGSTISGTGVIDIGKGTSLNSSTGSVFNTSEDFNIIINDNNGGVLTNSGEIIFGESLELSYTGSFNGTGIKVNVCGGTEMDCLLGFGKTIYDGDVLLNTIIPINESFTGGLYSYIYKLGDVNLGILESVKLNITTFELNKNDFTFNYTPSIFTGTLDFNSGYITNNTGTYIELSSTHYPVDYEITGDVVGTYTGTLNNSGSILVELTSGDGVKTLSGVLENLVNEFSQTFTGSIVLDQTAPIIVLGANTSTGTSAKSIEFNFSTGDSDFNTGSILWSNNLNSNTGTGLIYEVSLESSTGLVVTLNFSDILGNNGSIDSEAYIIDNTGPEAPINLFLNDGGIINVSNVTNLSLSGSGNITESGAIINYSFEDSLTGTVYGTGILSGENFIINSLNLTSLSDGTIDYSVYFTDLLGNTGSIATGLTTKEAIAPTGTINLLSITNNTGSLVNLTSSEYPVNYEITGDIVGTSTGILANSGAVSIELIAGEGLKNISVIFTDLGSNTSLTYTGSIILDQTLPVLNILSHSNNDEVESGIITLTGTVSDINSLGDLIIAGNNITILSDAYSTDINIDSGENIIEYSLIDNAGNTLTGSINLVGINTDTIPDNFVFTDILSSELSLENISNTITVTGTNTGSIVSITNGSYSINSGIYTNLNGIINSGDTIKIKLASSSSNSTKVDSTLNIGSVSDIYSITTKASSSSSSSGGGGSGGPSSYSTCLDIQLECRSVAGSETLFKLYKKNGFTCIGGNLGNECNINTVVTKGQTIDIIDGDLVLKNKIIEKLFNDKTANLINIDDKTSEISYLGEDINLYKSNYISMYKNWINSLSKIDSLLTEKNTESAKKEIMTFLIIYKALKNYSDDLKIGSIIVNGGEVKYLKYNDKKIQKIQILLFSNIKKKKANIEVYKLANRVVHNLNKLLTDKTLSKDQIKEIRVETISIYKNYIKEYSTLPKK